MWRFTYRNRSNMTSERLPGPQFMPEKNTRKELLGAFVGALILVAVFTSAVVLALFVLNISHEVGTLREKVTTLTERAERDQGEIVKLYARAEREQHETVSLRERLAVVESQLRDENSEPNYAEQEQDFDTGSEPSPEGERSDAVELQNNNATMGGLAQKSDRRGSGGAVYIRWGRTTCPFDATTVYSGVAGGSWFSHPGSGTNYQCLPLDPQWGRYQDGTDGEWSAYMYGAEYEVASDIPFGSNSFHNQNVPCAVCYVPTRGSKLMIPARNSCYDGWSKEYDGYLMAQYYKHAGATEYVCVDGEPEAAQDERDNQDGTLFHPVEARCGSLPCPSYVEGRELTCVVCTK